MRIVKYGEIVRGAREAYRKYVEDGKSMSRAYDLVTSIDKNCLDC